MNMHLAPEFSLLCLAARPANDENMGALRNSIGPASDWPAGIEGAQRNRVTSLVLASLQACGSSQIPFKRNSVIPYQSIIDFIATNETGSVLVISTDPIVPWVLRHQHDRDDRCVSYFLTGVECLVSGCRYDSILVIAGHNNTSEDAAFGRTFDSALEKLVAGRRKVATIHAGLDEDARLKSRLTGTPLDKYILTVDHYQ
jgi:hypothetical protein